MKKLILQAIHLLWQNPFYSLVAINEHGVVASSRLVHHCPVGLPGVQSAGRAASSYLGSEKKYCSHIERRRIR